MSKLKIVLLFCILTLSSMLYGQSMKIECTHVNTNGSVTLSWQYTGVVAGFDNYKIYRKASTGDTPVLLTTLTNIAVTSYTDITVNARLASFIYTAEATVSGAQTGIDSMNTIFLTVNNMSNTYALLNWTAPFQSYSNPYNVYRKIPDGGWILLGTTTNTVYQDSVPHVCNDTIAFKIEASTSASCNSVSNIQESLFKDVQSPDMPTNDSVSINVLSQKIMLGWKASTAPDVKGYIICKGSPCIALDTIYGKNNTNYTWLAGDPNIEYSFRIVSFDSCLNTSLVTEYQNNMVLHVTTKSCSREVTLQWNQYQNLYPSTTSYTVFVKNAGGNYASVKKVPSTQTTTTYTVPDDITDVCFFVRASNADSSITSSSNVVCKNLDSPDTAQFLYIRNASVSEGNKSVVLTLYVDGSFATDYYDVYRWAAGESPKKIGAVSYTGNNDIVYADNTAQAGKSPCNYYISTKDACKIREQKSNLVTTVCLQLENQNQTNKLIWTPYNGWNNIEGYELYRKTKNVAPSLLGTFSDTDRKYVDNLANIGAINEELIYYVIAVEGSGNKYGFKDEAVSSSVSYVKDGLIVFPTAFTPQANTNTVFLPVFLFMEETQYKLCIYNRFGNLIFESTNAYVGWDGKYKGEYVPVGVYAYKVECLFSKGEKFTKTGIVNVLN